MPAHLPPATADPELVIGLGALIALCLLVDLELFARGREPRFRESVAWSVGWLLFSLLAAIPFALVEGTDAAINYTTVYLIERTLSLDNLFVFLLLFAYFAVPQALRPRLLFWGIVVALVLRGAAILGGVALLERFHFVVYVMGVALLVLSWRMYKGVEEGADPHGNLAVRLTRRLFPVTHGYEGRHWFKRTGGRLHVTPLFLCLVSFAFADIAFAIDSIPAAFAITTDAAVIWAANAFALLGLRALFVLVEGLVRRFRYLDATIAFVLGIVALKLLLSDVVHVSAPASLAIVVVAFAAGIAASLLADRRDPEGAAARGRSSGLQDAAARGRAEAGTRP